MEIFCTGPLIVLFIIIAFLNRKHPEQMSDEEMMEQVMAMEIVDDESWDEPW